MTTVWPVSRLVADLRLLGVQPGDVLMVHASLRAIGPVEGGAAGVVEAMDAAVGTAGTILMVLGAQDDFSWVNDRPEADRPALLADAVPFDAATTAADPDVGTLAEVFRGLPGTRVNDHPEGRFAARGRLAAALISDPPWDDYYGPGSPLHRLVDVDGKVLRLGADPDTVTLFHYAEYLADVPDKRRVVRYRKVAGDTGPEIVRIESLDDSAGIVDYPGEDYFAAALRAYLATGRAAVGRVGSAAAELIDAADVVRFAAAWMTANLVPDAAHRE